MTSTPALPPLESAWRTLWPSLEAQGSFALIFVFNGNSRLEELLFERCFELFRAQAKTLQRQRPETPEALGREFVSQVLQPDSAWVRAGMPLWLDLDSGPDDPAWDQARATFLMRLNERRAALTREHPRPMVCVLPHDWTKRAAETAPDLWTIRQPTLMLAPAATDTTADARSGSVEGAGVTAVGDLPASVQRWQRAGRDPSESISVWDAVQAAQDAMASGRAELAREIAAQAVEQARLAGEKRELSVALGSQGDIVQALGRLDQAQAAFREGEALARRLLDEFGTTPERLRDLSVSMERLGDNAQALGRLDQAQAAFREGETLARRLLDEFGTTPERLRDLSVSMNKLGDIAQALGRLVQAQAAFREGEALDRRLLDEFGATPERLRDLSISMARLGVVARAMGRLGEAAQAYAEALRIAERLLATYGESVPALEVKAELLTKVGELALGEGRRDDALQQLREARGLYERLSLVAPHDSRYQRALDAISELLAAPASNAPQ